LKRAEGTADLDRDEAFLDQLRVRDHRAFERLVDAFGPMVYNLVLRLVRDRDLAEDLTQEIFIRIYGGLPRFRGGSRLSTWIYRITHNAAMNELQKARYRREGLGLDEIGPGEPAGADFTEDPLERVERDESRRRMARWIEELRPEQRSALTLYYSAGKNYREIADILEVPIGTVKTLLYRAKKELRGRLRKEREN
jgi:RNA polymerase sigma-70 factor (ECF subfamily)